MLAHLVVVLPGGTTIPGTALLLLPALAFEELGAKVERVSYEEARVRRPGLEDSGEFKARVTEQVTEILDILEGSWLFCGPRRRHSTSLPSSPCRTTPGPGGPCAAAAAATSTPVTTTAVPPTALCPS